MTQKPRLTVTLSECYETALVGGKAANLGRLVRAGFPVPEGFVLTTRAYRLAYSAPQDEQVPSQLPADAAEELRLAYQELGEGPVAVRSSATAEDAVAASLAGQYETILNVEGEAALYQAVLRCWASLDVPRTRAYLQEHGIDAAGMAMAVVVQRFVPADVAGVLFTTHPLKSHRGEMLLEANWGLGESLVSGQVQPDSLRLDQETGRVLAVRIGDKLGDESRRHQACLRGIDVYRLWQLGKRVVHQFGSPQDIEWPIRGKDLYILQARPITTLEDASAYEDVVSSTQQQLRQQAALGRGPWVLHNLAETLPHPTPLT